MDELHLELPFAGSRMLRDLLNAEGLVIGRQHVASPSAWTAKDRRTARSILGAGSVRIA